MEYSIKDAFKELNILNEAEEFNLTKEWDVDKLHNIISGDVSDEFVDVIDPSMSSGDSELRDGDCIVQCTVCGTNQFKHPEDLIYDDESELYNVEEECVYCHQVSGFKKIGLFKACDDIKCTTDSSNLCETDKTSEPISDITPVVTSSAEQTTAPLDESATFNMSADEFKKAVARKFNVEDEPLNESSEDELLGDHLDKLMKKESIEESAKDEEQESSDVASSYEKFIPDDLYNDVKSGITDISLINRDELDDILAKGDFTDAQKEFLRTKHLESTQHKLNSFVDDLDR